jgi:RimJ/RimL family protein N-acetyltransferase
MPVEFMRASLEKDRARAASILGIEIPPEWPSDDDLFMLKIRLEDVGEHPEWAPWLLRAIVDKQSARMLGYINFHMPPNDDGMVEVGYEIFPAHRRKGYAEEAVRALFSWALEQGGVKTFRASVGPTNEPSLKMIEKLGFTHVGEQWDEIDGRELVFELHPQSN